MMNWKTDIKLLSFLMLISFVSFAQKEDWKKLQEQYKDAYLITKPHQEIALDTVVLSPKPKFKDSYAKRYYAWLKKKTYKAYPYAVLAKEKMAVLDDSIQKISSSRKRKKFIKQKQKFFKKQFADDIKKLTRTEGRILLKLVHRLTGQTVNEHVQDKRGKFRAFLYRVSASLFKIDLDITYHPEKVMEDYIIETILQQAFLYDELQELPSVLEHQKQPLSTQIITVKKKK